MLLDDKRQRAEGRHLVLTLRLLLRCFACRSLYVLPRGQGPGAAVCAQSQGAPLSRSNGFEAPQAPAQRPTAAWVSTSRPSSHQQSDGRDVRFAFLCGFLSGLGATGSCITSLDLSLTVTSQSTRKDSSIVKEFLQGVADACPRLASLTLDRCISSLPAAPPLPHLTQLAITFPNPVADRAVVESFSMSLAPFVPQLTSLRIVTAPGAQWPTWPSVFKATAHILTHIHTDAALTDELLGLLLQHATALTELRAGYLSLRTDEHKGKEWEVQRVDVRFGNGGVSDLLRLPASKAGTVVVHDRNAEVSISVASAQVSPKHGAHYIASVSTHATQVPIAIPLV